VRLQQSGEAAIVVADRGGPVPRGAGAQDRARLSAGDRLAQTAPNAALTESNSNAVWIIRQRAGAAADPGHRADRQQPGVPRVDREQCRSGGARLSLDLRSEE